MNGEPDFLKDIVTRETGVYRYQAYLQAGTSVFPLEKPYTHYNICDPYYDLSYIVVGNGVYVDHKGNRWPYYPGCLMQRFPGLLSDTIYHPGNYIDKFIVLPPQFHDALKACHVAAALSPIVDVGLSAYFCHRFDDIAESLRRQPEERLHLSMAEIFEFACELLAAAGASRHSSLMERAAELLGKKPEAKLSMPGVAAALNMSYANFRRVFTEYYGVSPVKYRIRKKLEQAQKLLRSGGRTVKEVAELFGYADQYVFSKQFKAHVGINPHDFSRSPAGRPRGTASAAQDK